MNRERCRDLSMFPTRNPISHRLINPLKRHSTYDRLGMKCYDYGYDLVPCSRPSYVRNPRTRRCRSPSPKRRRSRSRSRSRSPLRRRSRPRSRSRSRASRERSELLRMNNYYNW